MAITTRETPLTLSGEFKLSGDAAGLGSAQRAGIERRAKRRIQDPFPICVRGKDALGQTFEVESVVDNMSSKGMFIRLPREITTGEDLAMTIRFDNRRGSSESAILSCKVIRAERQGNGVFGVAVTIEHYKFL